jgi:hypothetical protein
LEIGQVLTRCLPDGAATDGAVLRQVTLADRLLLARLEQHRHQAFTACQELLQQRDLPAVLVDVEALFDGQSLLFYFLGEITPELEAITSQLAETFDTKVQLRRFAKSLAEGCGPGCGTESADGCGSTGCSTCAVAKACQSRN